MVTKSRTRLSNWSDLIWYVFKKDDVHAVFEVWKLKVLVTQLCPTLCNPLDCSRPYSSIHGILQARTLEWVAMPFPKGSSWPRDRTWVSHIAGRFFTIWARNLFISYLDLTGLPAFYLAILQCKMLKDVWADFWLSQWLASTIGN